ncbi:MAG: hypothetical protein COB67_10555 [SAR324 cluster bacterium]|uniref:Uncharacterized protein n=1 Tax=SAR324 cluster bacterium TaxID=2024889 RepID=A0A2A4SXB1_9DELT|nr:MAG: hypothetical protein COB67_10555 [SAR324 cluster bacterium]
MKKSLLPLLLALIFGVSAQAELIPSVFIENYRYTIFSSQKGRIKILVAKGDQVQKGDRLFELGIEELQVKLDLASLRIEKSKARLKQLERSKQRKDQKSAKALEQAKLKFSQQKALHAAGELSLNALQLAQVEHDLVVLSEEEEFLTLAQLDLKENQLRLKQLKLEYQSRTESAPATGQVTELFVRSVEWVNKGQKVIELLSINPLFTKIMIPIKKARAFKRNETFKIFINHGADMIETQGIIDYISDEVDPLDQTVKIFLKIENDTLQLKPGTRVRIELP